VTGTVSRFRWASPTTAVVLGVVSLLSQVAQFVLQGLGHQLPTSSTDIANTAAGVVFVLAFTAVAVVVARRQPGNPMGWLLIAVPLAIQAGNVGSQYAYLDYTVKHGTLPLGPLAVLLMPSWEYALMLLPLVILLFPDGRPGARWRWPLRVYSGLAVALVAGTVSVVVAALGLRTPLDGNGNLVGLNHPSGGDAWFAPVQFAFGGAIILLTIASIVYQVHSYRRASGVRRQQLKWLAAGSATLVVCFLVLALSGGSGGLLGGVAFSLGLSALPVAMGVSILRYRLYEIDRLVSRTLSYAILTALLVGTFIGLIALSTDTFALSGRVGVAASTLGAAALFNPLRVRIQRLVDRRFNRARYDAEATVAAFTARLRDAVEIAAIRSDLLDTVNRAVQPTHASVWIKPHARG
jgi:hypothetical protein